MSALIAFLHHLAAFTMVAALVVEFVLIRGELNPVLARRLARADMVYGLSATALLGIGLLRVFYFEKGAAYYFHNAAFIAKLALFLLIAVLSIYPTQVHSQGTSGAPPPLHLELAGVVLILLFAALMADGIGFFG